MHTCVLTCTLTSPTATSHQPIQGQPQSPPNHPTSQPASFCRLRDSQALRKCGRRGLRDIDSLERQGPLGAEGPIPDSDSPWLTSLYDPPTEPYKFHFSGIDNPCEEEYGDPGRFRAECVRQASAGVDATRLPMDSLPRPTEGMQAPVIRLQESRTLAALNAHADYSLSHPGDWSRVAQLKAALGKPGLGGPGPRGPFGLQPSLHEGPASIGHFVDPNTGFEPEKHKVSLTHSTGHLTMSFS